MSLVSKMLVYFFLINPIHSIMEVNRSIPAERKIAELGEFPYQVLVVRLLTNAIPCSGSILNASFVLTTAQCTYDLQLRKLPEELIQVIAGQIDFDSVLYHKKNLTVKSIIRHPRFETSGRDNDIAFLELNEKLEMSVVINTIPLNQKKVVNNLTCILSGWGQGLYNERNEINQILTKIELKTLTLQSCTQFLKQKWGVLVILPDGIFCTYSRDLTEHNNTGPVDSCEDDPGGPLVCNGVLTGIVTRGPGCGSHPAMYTDIMWHLPWIKYQGHEPGVIRSRSISRPRLSEKSRHGDSLKAFCVVFYLVIVVAIKF